MEERKETIWLLCNPMSLVLLVHVKQRKGRKEEGSLVEVFKKIRLGKAKP